MPVSQKPIAHLIQLPSASLTSLVSDEVISFINSRKAHFHRGHEVQVFGIYPNGISSISADYSIDNGVPFMREIPGTPDGSLGGQHLSQLPSNLDEGQHTLRINAINATQNRPYTITSFQVCKLSTETKHKSNTGTITGAVVGGAILLFLLIFVFGWLHVRRQRRDKEKATVWAEGTKPSLGE